MRNLAVIDWMRIRARNLRRGTLVLLVSVITALVVLGLGVSAAYGYFTSTGSGSGSSAAGTMQTVTVVAFVGGDAPSTMLVPGGSADVILRVDNLNKSAVTLTSVTSDGTITASGGSGVCNTTGVTFTNQTGMDISLAASGETLVHLSNAASMSLSSQTGCQGATFSIPVQIAVEQQ